MGDEGVGVEVIKELEKRGYSERVELVDAGTSFFSIVSNLDNFDKLIIVDVTRGGQSPGTIYRFEMGDTEVVNDKTLSLHDIGVIESLKLEGLVRKMPKEIVFFGIEPYKIELSIELSPIIKSRFEDLVRKVLEELEKDRIKIEN